MAIVKCKECKQEVSTKAKTCPNCGVKNPGVKTSALVKVIAVLFALGFIGSIFTESNTQSKSKPSQTTKPTKTPEQIAAEEAICKKDIQCWGQKHSVSARVYCVDYVEKLAKYSHEWTDGMLESKFSLFRFKDKSKGVVTYIGDKIKFQNGFGAWENYIYECDFDPSSDSVIDVRADSGRL